MMKDESNREEHLEFCKKRALEYVEAGDLKNAFSSFLSDMKNHAETCDHVALNLGMMLMMSGNLDSPLQMTEWVNGFN